MKPKLVDLSEARQSRYPIDEYARAVLEKVLNMAPVNIVILIETDDHIDWLPVAGGESAAFGLVNDCFSLMQNVRECEEQSLQKRLKFCVCCWECEANL